MVLLEEKMRKKKELDKPQKIRTSLEELEVLARLKETVEWTIVKRVAQRYITNLTKIAFNLQESDSDLAVRHAQLTSEAVGIKRLVRIVDKSGKKLESMEKNG